MLMVMVDLIGCYVIVLDQYLVDLLVLVLLVMFDFLCIYLFFDGNGCMFCLLILLLFYYFDYVVGCYISLECIFEDIKEGL